MRLTSSPTPHFPLETRSIAGRAFCERAPRFADSRLCGRCDRRRRFFSSVPFFIRGHVERLVLPHSPRQRVSADRRWIEDKSRTIHFQVSRYRRLSWCVLAAARSPKARL
jgi:hypothetical protein